MKHLIALSICFLLAACCTEPRKPETVYVPVATPCKTETPNKPTYRFAPPYNNVFDGVRDLMGDREVSQAYENELNVALKSCK